MSERGGERGREGESEREGEGERERERGQGRRENKTLPIYHGVLIRGSHHLTFPCLNKPPLHGSPSLQQYQGGPNDLPLQIPVLHKTTC